ncbi:aspartate/glutamate racemase family protein [Amycolatopsis cihanbeyliensis]|uniref:Aspartate racemase n=1 Tax=Amycolatopsis cihanbeyliensis TaxID=1128664 RepID=A0A542DRH7_AMYCI|nr:aspartate/glutamate racemase family protein [Amycolatopsis cihanbeyliensis]TQJ05712.1 aspartate racemase [Amycolatopsis cihanbeyliensis]
MKTIGLLGGMSWESSAEYYRLLNEFVRDTLGGLHSARCVLYSVDFAEIERMQAEASWDEAGKVLLAAGTALRRAGAEVLVLCTNTMHKVADVLAEGLDIPLLHLADACADAIIRSGIERVGLLGTGFTMAQPFYRDRLAAHGLEVLVPAEEDRERVHRIIYDELVRGVVTEESRQAYREVMGRLAERGARGMIYGCTEIELLVGPRDSPVPTFPTTRLHVAAAAGYAVGTAPLPPSPDTRTISGISPEAGSSSRS